MGKKNIEPANVLINGVERLGRCRECQNDLYLDRWTIGMSRPSLPMERSDQKTTPTDKFVTKLATRTWCNGVAQVNSGSPSVE